VRQYRVGYPSLACCCWFDTLPPRSGCRRSGACGCDDRQRRWSSYDQSAGREFHRFRAETLFL